MGAEREIIGGGFVSLEAERAAEPPESLPEPSLGAGLRGGPAAPRGLGGGWMVPGGRRRRARSGSTLCLQWIWGEAPQVRVPSGPPLPAAHSPAAGAPWGWPGTCGAESRGTPVGGVGRKGARGRPPQGTPVETGVSPSPPLPLRHPGQDAAHGVSRRQGHGVPAGLRGDTRARGRRLHRGATHMW